MHSLNSRLWHCPWVGAIEGNLFLRWVSNASVLFVDLQKSSSLISLWNFLLISIAINSDIENVSIRFECQEKNHENSWRLRFSFLQRRIWGKISIKGFSFHAITSGGGRGVVICTLCKYN
jgi:hypothetical protein